MFKNYGENRFRKQFPNLKQVINEVEVDFDMYAQVPLKIGENSVYLKDQDGKKSVYTTFEVDNYHKYGLRIEMNYPYVMQKIKVQLITILIVGMVVSLLVQLAFVNAGLWALFLSFLVLVAIYIGAVSRLVKKLGISAYKVEVSSEKLSS